eukprot:2911344-Rhodomonas_salina.1
MKGPASRVAFAVPGSIAWDAREQTPESVLCAETVGLGITEFHVRARVPDAALLAQTAILDSTEWVVREQTREA